MIVHICRPARKPYEGTPLLAKPSDTLCKLVGDNWDYDHSWVDLANIPAYADQVNCGECLAAAAAIALSPVRLWSWEDNGS